MNELGRHSDWGAVRVLVAGFGASGYAAADSLTFLGAQVTAVDHTVDEDKNERAQLLNELGAQVWLGIDDSWTLPDDVDLVIASPGWRPDAPLLLEARDRGVPIWSEVELAWRLRDPETAPPWITITGTNGKTTVTGMVHAIAQAAGLASAAVGNIGRPVVEAVMDPTPYDLFAVELSSFQLHFSSSLSPLASVCLNFAEDHLDWYDNLSDYRADKATVYSQTQVACVYNVEDPETEAMVEEADVVEGARAIGFTLGVPAPSMVGVVDDLLVDRAFVESRRTSAAEICAIADLASAHPHFIRNALAAIALTRAAGISPAAVAAGLKAYRPDGHRIAHVATVQDVDYIDDSKATNPHAAASSLAAYDSVVWVAGGLAKGARFDALIQAHQRRLRGVVLLGADRAVIAEALSRHAPDVPVIDVAAGETSEVMDRAVQAAAELARPGDTVLLAPGCASFDLFAGYGARGQAFADAVRRLRA